MFWPGPIHLLAAGLVFVGLAALWLALTLLRAGRRKSQMLFVEQRLGLVESEDLKPKVLRLWKDGREATTTVLERTRGSLRSRAETFLQRAGLQVPLASFVLIVASCLGLVFFALYELLPNAVPAAVTVVLLASLIRIWLKGRTQRRLVVFERQFVEALELAARSLRAGHPLLGAFRLVADEVDPPVGEIFADICQRQELGEPLEAALHKAANASGSADMTLFATSVIIQIRSGGNLADMIDRLAAVIRDRLRLNRRVRVLSAQTQLSKRVLIALPIVMFVLLSLLNPAYMSPLYETEVGKILLICAAAGTLTGMWIMNRLAVLRY